MEDGLERNMTTLFKINEGIQNKKNNSIEILYVYIPHNEKVENYIITQNYEIVNNLAKEKNGRIVIFNKDTDGLYKFYNK
jgi:isopentenyl phosphate kinase